MPELKNEQEGWESGAKMQMLSGIVQYQQKITENQGKHQDQVTGLDKSK